MTTTGGDNGDLCEFSAPKGVLPIKTPYVDLLENPKLSDKNSQVYQKLVVKDIY